MYWTMLATLIAAMGLIGTFLTYMMTKAFNLGELTSKLSAMSASIEKLDVRIGQVESKLDGKMEQLESKLDKKMEQLESKLDGKIQLLESRLDRRIERLEDTVRAVNDVVMANNADLKTIKAVLNIKENTEYEYGNRHSPWTLNELGAKLYREMKGEELLTENKDVFFAMIDRQHPKAALDVEQAARIACINVVNEDFFVPIKTFIYNCPLQDVPGKEGKKTNVDINAVCFILSIPLRDMYLDAHKEIPTK